MSIVNSYKFIRILSIISFLTVLWQYWGTGFLGYVLLLSPYVVVYMLSNVKAYKTRLNALCRYTCGMVIFILAIGLLFGIESDPQAGIGVMFGVLIQYAVLFISEAIIGLASFKESS